MNLKFILLIASAIFVGGHLSSQVGVNNTSPIATLDIVTVSTGDKVLKLSEVYNNVDATATDINYTKGSPLYIDNQGYVYKLFTPTALTGLSTPFDKNAMAITTTWQTIYTLPSPGSIAYFSFFTNITFESGNTSLIAGQASVGTGTGLDVYDYNSSVTAISSLTGNQTKNVVISFADGDGLEFQLTSARALQVRLSTASTNNATITIYDSKVTRS